MLRITPIQSNGAPMTLKVEGKVLAEWVVVLEQECQRWLAKRGRVVMDLSQVTFVDDRGIEMLQRLPTHRVSIIHGSAFIAELLDGGGRHEGHQ